MSISRARSSSSDCFATFAVEWSGLERKSATGLGDDGAFYLVTGHYPFDAPHQAAMHFSKALGASLVFLIDWNKARKILQEWISKADAVRILDWAALPSRRPPGVP